MLLKRIFATKEVKAALGVVDECELLFSSNMLWGDCFKIIKAELVPYIYKNQKTLTKHIQSGRTVRECVYSAIAEIAQNHITSGQYHTYRGVLNSLSPGPVLHKMFEKAIDLLVKEGSMTSENANQWKADLQKQISEFG